MKSVISLNYNDSCYFRFKTSQSFRSFQLKILNLNQQPLNRFTQRINCRESDSLRIQSQRSSEEYHCTLEFCFFSFQSSLPWNAFDASNVLALDPNLIAGRYLLCMLLSCHIINKIYPLCGTVYKGKVLIISNFH